MDSDTFSNTSQIELINREPITQNNHDLTDTLPDLPTTTCVLHIDYVYPPQARIQAWSEMESETPAEVGIIHTGYAVDDVQAIEQFGAEQNIQTSCTHITHPNDIEQIGLELVKYLSQKNTETDLMVVYFDSISLVLQYVSTKVVTKFIVECRNQIEDHDALGRFFFTPQAHNTDTVAQIQSILD